MKIKAMALAAILMLGSVITGVALVLPSAATTDGGNDNRPGGKGAVVTRIPMTPLQCGNSGGHQDVAKEPVITNTTSKTLPKGQKIYWKASDGDKGVVTLDAPLAPGKWVIDRGHPGQNYTCTASTPLALF